MSTQTGAAPQARRAMMSPVDLIALVTAPVLGVLAIVLVAVSDPGLKRYDAPLFPLVRTGIEGLGGSSLLFLGLAGFCVGAFSRLPPWLLGLATMALFPVISITEVIVDSSSHKLLGLEGVLYGLLTIPGIIGAYIGRRVGRRLRERIFQRPGKSSMG